MRIFSLSSALYVACTLAPVPFVQAQSPCGVVTESTALTADCYGTLAIEADNITVDLNGHTLFGNLGSVERPAVEIKNRRGVILKNGTVIASPGAGGGVLISGGRSNVLSDLTLNAGENVRSVLDVASQRNALTRLNVNLYPNSGGITLGGSWNSLSESSINGQMGPSRVLDIKGSSNSLVFNYIEAGNVGLNDDPAGTFGFVTIAGVGHVVEQNRIEGTVNGRVRPTVSVLPDSKKITIRANSLGNTNPALKVSGSQHVIAENLLYTSNHIGLHLDSAEHAVVENNISGDNEVGIFIDRGTANKISFNHFVPDTYLAIDVKSDGNTISDNRIDQQPNGAQGGIVIEGLRNSITRNVVVNSGSPPNIDMIDTTPDCGTNKWRKNTFTTDSEGDGPEAGCIR